MNQPHSGKYAWPIRCFMPCLHSHVPAWSLSQLQCMRRGIIWEGACQGSSIDHPPEISPMGFCCCIIRRIKLHSKPWEPQRYHWYFTVSQTILSNVFFFFFLFFYLLCANKERIISQTPWGIFTVPSSPKSHKGMSYIIHRGYQPSPPFYSDSSNAALQSAASVFCGVLVLFRFRAKSNCYTGSGGKCNSSRTTERDIKNETPICEKESFYIWNKMIRFFFFVYL